MSKVVLFGEIMLRLSPEGFNRFVQADKFNVHYGGSEANVIISLCHLGHKGRYVTRVSNDELGLGAIDYLKTQDVDVSFIQSRGEHPLGTSIVEEGEGCRPSVVIYNRKWSSAAQMRPTDFDFKEILKDGNIFHVSGITLSISEKARTTAIEAMKQAKAIRAEENARKSASARRRAAEDPEYAQQRKAKQKEANRHHAQLRKAPRR